MEHEVIKELKELKDSGLSYDHLGKVLDFPATTIYRWLRDERISPIYAEVLQGRIKAYYEKKNSASLPKEAKDGTVTTS